MNKSNFKFKNVLVVLILSIFVCFGIFTLLSLNKSEKVSFADDSSTIAVFESSNVFTPNLAFTSTYSNATSQKFSSLTSLQNYGTFWSNYFMFKYDSTSQSFSFGYNAFANATLYLSLPNTSDYSTYPLNFGSSSSVYIVKTFTLNSTDDNFYFYTVGKCINNNFYTPISCVVTRGTAEPTLQMVSVELGNYTESIADRFNSNTKSGYFNVVSYVDTNGWRYSLAIPTKYASSDTFANRPMFFYNYRLYKLRDTGSLTDSDYYNTGYNDGYNNGKADGQSSGYSSGYSDGDSAGYTRGFTEGQEAGGDYTFLSLLSAVFDAPINAFKSLFNFDLLGFNLLSFITGLITLALVIFIVKKVAGGE